MGLAASISDNCISLWLNVTRDLRDVAHGAGGDPGGTLVMIRSALGVAAVLALLLAILPHAEPVHAEYGDVVINNYSDQEGMRPVVFPHWFHRIRFRCKVCHADLGFKFQAGGNEIDMLKIIDGEYCGACHNGEVAWSVENCNLCHSGKPGTPMQVHLSTVQRLISGTPK